MLPSHKLRSDIPGHSVSMLHMQLYARGTYHKDKNWELGTDSPPNGVLDPTPLLLNALNSPSSIFTKDEVKTRTDVSDNVIPSGCLINFAYPG